MENVIKETIDFLSKTFPKIYSSLYLDYLKLYSSNYNVNKNQLRALLFIKNNGSISMTDLCAKLNIEKGSLTSMVDDLTNKGYVIRIKDVVDRRKYLIDITDEGDIIASDFISKLSIRLEEKLSVLSNDEVYRFQNSINTLQDILSKDELK